MTASIVQGTTSVAFVYDSEHNRVKQTLTVGSTSTVTTYLDDPATGAKSEMVMVSGTATWHDYVIADGQIKVERFSGGTTAVRYFVNDRLGSVSSVTNENGEVVERDAYDARGKRRNILDGSDDSTCSLTSLTTRGYTGHEQIDATCLVVRLRERPPCGEGWRVKTWAYA